MPSFLSESSSEDPARLVHNTIVQLLFCVFVLCPAAYVDSFDDISLTKTSCW